MKYRQRGYRESDPREDREGRRPPAQQLTEEERIQRRSMRKATGGLVTTSVFSISANASSRAARAVLWVTTTPMRRC